MSEETGTGEANEQTLPAFTWESTDEPKLFLIFSGSVVSFYDSFLGASMQSSTVAEHQRIVDTLREVAEKIENDQGRLCPPTLVSNMRQAATVIEQRVLGKPE